MTHQTAHTLRERGVILATRRSTDFPKVRRTLVVKIPLDEHTIVLALDKVDFSFKEFAVVHFDYLSLS
jgi:hypothetical protein